LFFEILIAIFHLYLSVPTRSFPIDNKVMAPVTGYCVFGVLRPEGDMEAIVRKFSEFADKRGYPWARIWFPAGFFGVVSGDNKATIDPERMATEVGCTVDYCGILLSPTSTPANLLPAERQEMLQRQLNSLAKFYKVSEPRLYSVKQF
jgi:hypothetical protein